jgi:hypothetical protein
MRLQEESKQLQVAQSMSGMRQNQGSRVEREQNQNSQRSAYSTNN